MTRLYSSGWSTVVFKMWFEINTLEELMLIAPYMKLHRCLFSSCEVFKHCIYVGGSAANWPQPGIFHAANAFKSKIFNPRRGVKVPIIKTSHSSYSNPNNNNFYQN